MTKRPTIGILMDYEADGSFSSRPHYALRTGYFDAIWRAGGSPLGVPYLTGAIDDILGTCSGFVFPGGFYPFPARIYGEGDIRGENIHPRYAFESHFMKQILAHNIPVLGICAGMQVIASEMGGTMYRNIGKETDTDFDHLNAMPAEQAAHAVTITKDTLLHHVIGAETLHVNTAHSEALKTAADGLIINAVADDGIVEGIEVPDQLFCLGVQWHPEFFATDGNANFKLFQALTAAANGKDF